MRTIALAAIVTLLPASGYCDISESGDLLLGGNLAIGTTTISSALRVHDGDIRISTSSGSRGIIFQDGTTQTTAGDASLSSNNTFTGINRFTGDIFTSSGTWTPTWGGFSTPPSACSAVFTRIGKFVRASGNCNAGTSNATTLTLTLPIAATRASIAQGFGIAFDNGSFSANPARIDTRNGSTTADVYRSFQGDVWTASGGKTVDFHVLYEAQ